MGDYKLKFWQSQNGERPVRDWVVSLEHEQKKKVDRLFKLLEEFGPALRMPNGKSLGGGLYEARDDSKGPGFRVYYQRIGALILVLLVGGDKSTQDRDIKTARLRMLNLEREK